MSWTEYYARPGFSASAQGFVSGRRGAEAHENPFPPETRKAKNWEASRVEGRKHFEAALERLLSC